MKTATNGVSSVSADFKFGPEFATEQTAPSVQEQAQVLAAHMTATETASLVAERDTLTTELATVRGELESAHARIEELMTALDAAKVANDTVTAEFAAFKQELEVKALRESRKAEIASVAPALVQEGEGLEARLDRLAKMDEAEFADYVASIKVVADAKPTTSTMETASVTARPGTTTTSGGVSPTAQILGVN